MTVSNSARQTITLIRFDYNDTGTPQYKAYNNGPSTVVHATYGTFTSLPEMAVKMPKLDGLIEDKEAEIEMREVSPFDLFNSGDPFPPITATIYLADADDVDNTIVVIFSGRVSRVLANADGVPGVMQAFVAGWRSFTKDRVMGLSATTTCAWTFGDRSCLFDSSASQLTATVTDVAGTALSIDLGDGDLTPGDYTRGSLRRGDLAIMIRSIELILPDDYYVFQLSRKAPTRWLNQQITLFPGCAKTIDACRYWGNEVRFGGCGIAIPAENPLYGGL